MNLVCLSLLKMKFLYFAAIEQSSVCIGYNEVALMATEIFKRGPGWLPSSKRPHSKWLCKNAATRLALPRNC